VRVFALFPGVTSKLLSFTALQKKNVTHACRTLELLAGQAGWSIQIYVSAAKHQTIESQHAL
jgi:hypothetical protein